MRGRKKVQESFTTGSTAVLERTPVDLAVVPFDLVLGLRKLKSGPFAGLWELTCLSVDPKDATVVKVLTDATTKQFVIAKASREMRECI